MKPSKNTLEALEALPSLVTTGDLRQIVSVQLLALARKEVAAADILAMASLLDSISNSLNTEIRVAKAQVELRTLGGELGNVAQLGRLGIGKPEDPK